MKMTLKKEVKHSVVYETDEKGAAVRSVYVSKEWLRAHGGYANNGGLQKEIEVEVRVLP